MQAGVRQEVSAGVVYTKDWIADFMLDLIGYPADNSILDTVIIEPSCGNGIFLKAIVERLCTAFVKSSKKDWKTLSDSVRGYDISSAAVKEAEKELRQVLSRFGCSDLDITFLLSSWLKTTDFLLEENIPACDFIVGNPPYVRATDIDSDLRNQYTKSLPSFTRGCDLYVGFFEKSLSLLKENGKQCLICSDRWLQNAYGKHLRGLVNTRFNLKTVIRLYDCDVFRDRVCAYPSIT